MSKKLKLSPWHDGSVKPVHVGVYEVYCNCCGERWYSNWTGSHFSEVRSTRNEASLETSMDYFLSVGRWRGVLK